VAEGVEGRTLFAFLGARAGGEFRITSLNNSFDAIPFVLRVKLAA